MRTGILILIVATALVILWTFPSNAELVAYWPLDEGTGGEIEDATGNGYNGAFRGDPSWVDGVYGKALEFDGDDYVDVPAMSDVNPESITMATMMIWSLPAAMEGKDLSSPAKPGGLVDRLIKAACQE